MRTLVLALALVPVLALHPLVAALPAWAANEPPDPLIGAPNVTIERAPAARQGDPAGPTAVQGGSSNVTIGGRPAATVGSQTGCGGTIITGSSSVFINGKPAATGASSVTPCPK